MIEPNRSRIDALRSIVEDLKVTYETYAFSTYINKIDQKHIPSPNGGTRLGHALDQLLHNNRKKVVLITDGEAEDPARCLELAKNFELAIMYVGSGDRPQFLDDLANAAHGTCSTEDLRQKELTEKITLLLGSGSQVGDIQI